MQPLLQEDSRGRLLLPQFLTRQRYLDRTINAAVALGELLMRLAGDFRYNSHRFDSSREGLVLERVTLCLAARVTHPWSFCCLSTCLLRYLTVALSYPFGHFRLLPGCTGPSGGLTLSHRTTVI